MSESDVAPIAIAGATGFVGQALMHALGPTQKLIGLSRSVPEQTPHPSWEWRPCNLFNLKHTEQALRGARTAYYLVHSMMPPETLAQGHFYDMDLICADNFARAAKSQGVEHIIYLSGLIPAEKHLSAHLRSRLEVEKALGAHDVPVTTLRAGLVIGPGGSSYLMMARLAQRLPFMITPQWTRSKTQPIALPDVIALLRYAATHRELAGEPYDIGCPDVLSYADMLRRVAALGNRRLRILQVPIKSVRLSLWWVSLITQTSMQLVVPLVESLRHSMVVRDGLRLQKRVGITGMSFDDSIHMASHADPPPPLGKRLPVPPRARRSVLSVQRLPLPAGKDAIWVAQEYARWLPQFLWPMLRVDVDAARLYRFCLPFGNRALLELRFAPQRSSTTRQLFYVSGGLLAQDTQATEPGRFEFRTTLDNSYVLTAIHDFIPRLPWYVYKLTQALVHKFVMYFFGRHLHRLRAKSYPAKQASAQKI